MTNIETNLLVISWQSCHFIFSKCLCSKLFYSFCVINWKRLHLSAADCPTVWIHLSFQCSTMAFLMFSFHVYSVRRWDNSLISGVCHWKSKETTCSSNWRPYERNSLLSSTWPTKRFILTAVQFLLNFSASKHISW